MSPLAEESSRIAELDSVEKEDALRVGQNEGVES